MGDPTGKLYGCQDPRCPSAGRHRHEGTRVIWLEPDWPEAEMEGDPRADKALAPLWELKIPTSVYNKVYSAVMELVAHNDEFSQTFGELRERIVGLEHDLDEKGKLLDSADWSADCLASGMASIQDTARTEQAGSVGEGWRLALREIEEKAEAYLDELNKAAIAAAKSGLQRSTAMSTERDRLRAERDELHRRIDIARRALEGEPFCDEGG